jgi:hypothetical protein
MTVKCSKCGADIPENAAFCPSCGAPKPSQPAPQPKPTPMNTQPQKTSSGGMNNFIKTAFSMKLIALGLFIALLIAWITRVVGQFAYPGSMGVVSLTFMSGAGVILLFGGMLNPNHNKYLRLGMTISGALFLAMNI